jgi:hypothetical protein
MNEDGVLRPLEDFCKIEGNIRDDLEVIMYLPYPHGDKRSSKMQPYARADSTNVKTPYRNVCFDLDDDNGVLIHSVSGSIIWLTIA